MNSKLQFERHLQFTAVILLQQSHGFLVLIIPCYHAGTIKEANINNRTGRLLTVLLQIFRQCTINAFINASSMNSSMHSSMHHQCTIKRVSMGWWHLRLSAKIFALLRLSANFFKLRLTKKLTISFFCFKKLNIN